MDYLHEMKLEVLSKFDLLTVGETPAVAIAEGKMITHESNGVLNMLFPFDHVSVDHGDWGKVIKFLGSSEQCAPSGAKKEIGNLQT